MFFIRNKIKIDKILLIIVLTTLLIILFAFGYYIIRSGYKDVLERESVKDKELQIYLSYLYPNIDESIQYENINAINATKLMNYFFNKKGDSNKGKFWNQTCLFFKFSYCKQFSIDWGLKEEHNSIRKEFFLEDKDNLHLLVEGDKNTEENRCYVVFYKTQNDLETNKKEFLGNYPVCRKYYLETLPALIEYEDNFLKIFK